MLKQDSVGIEGKKKSFSTTKVVFCDRDCTRIEKKKKKIIRNEKMKDKKGEKVEKRVERRKSKEEGKVKGGKKMRGWKEKKRGLDAKFLLCQ